METTVPKMCNCCCRIKLRLGLVLGDWPVTMATPGDTSVDRRSTSTLFKTSVLLSTIVPLIDYSTNQFTIDWLTIRCSDQMFITTTRFLPLVPNSTLACRACLDQHLIAIRSPWIHGDHVRSSTSLITITQSLDSAQSQSSAVQTRTDWTFGNCD